MIQLLSNSDYTPLIQNPWIITAIVVGGFLLLCSIALFFVIFNVVFHFTMYRSPKKARTRECTNLKDESQMRMFEEGIKWREERKDKIEELHIKLDKLNLYAEYMDLGFDKCAVILQGRTESLLYSYYFADVYAKNGYNILTIDVRAHGLSDGKYVTAGIKESDDIVAWIKLINEKHNINDFAVHGICTGGAAAVYSYIKLKNEGKNLVKAIVTDGLFKTYFDLFKNHFKQYKKRPFPMLYMVFLKAFVKAKVRLFTETPYKYMPEFEVPFLLIYSKEDLFCKPDKAQDLFDACGSVNKELKFFPEGRHSHVRAVQEEDYDAAIDAFLKGIF